MGLPLIWPGDADFLGCLGHHLRVVISWPTGEWTTEIPDLFSERAAEAGDMVTERHQKQPQMRGIGSNEAASRIDTCMAIDASPSLSLS